ncbi:MAG: hypothetical protein JNJ45_03880 [Chthonomonas sp.]|nr:hypothetical protein [Chthonomonas sp.]
MKPRANSVLRLALAFSLVATQAFASVLDGYKLREIPNTKISIVVPEEMPEPEKLELDDSDKELFPSGLNYFFPGESEGMFSMLTVLKSSSSMEEDFLKTFAESYLEARADDKEIKYVIKTREAGTFGAFRGQAFTATLETSDIKMEEQGLVLIGDHEVLVYLVSADVADKTAVTEKNKAFDDLRYAGSAWAKGKEIEIKK